MSDAISFQIPWISLIIALPMIGALLLALVPSEHTQLHRAMAATFLGGALLAALGLLASYDPALAGIQGASPLEDRAWIPAIGARYSVGVDGLSIWLVMLTALLGPIVVLSAGQSVRTRVREFHVLVLLLQSAMVGALVAVDALLFYVFWELMLVPAYLLVGLWGGPRRVEAAMRMFLITMLGSVLMLGAILYLYAQTGFTSFALGALVEAARGLPFETQRVVFGALALAFLVKVPVPPFHIWVPLAHASAPVAVSILLVGIVEKGIYGLARWVIPVLPDAAYFFAPYLAAAGAVSVVWFLLVAATQRDLRQVIAYASIGHAGLVLFGLFTITDAGLTGALYQNVAHGIATVGLLLVAGMIEERRGSRLLADYGGLASRLPLLAALGVFFVMAAVGVPGLLGFVGEFLILAGGVSSYTLNFAGLTYFPGLDWGPELQAFAFTLVAGLGLILGAVYLLRATQLTFFGPVRDDLPATLPPLGARELSMLAPLALLCVVMGVWPRPFLDRMDDTVGAVLDATEQGADLYRPDVDEDVRRVEDYRRWLRETGADSPWSIGGRSHDAAHGADGDEAHADDHADGAH